MNQINKLQQLNNASFFTKETLSQVIGGSDKAIDDNILRWVKKGILLQLKNGLYVTNVYVSSLLNQEPFIEFIANILKKPSYVSCEYVLQKHGMLTESVFAVTSVSLKKTNIYRNKLGTFLYANIKEVLFTGYKLLVKDDFEIKEATKAKALFDFLYLRLWREQEISTELIRSYRFNLIEFSSTDFLEFESYIQLTTLKKMKILPVLLKEVADDR